MKKLMLMLTLFTLAGCLATENRKVAITTKTEGTAAVGSDTTAGVTTNTCWWRVPYYGYNPAHPMDKFIPAEDIPDKYRNLDSVERDLLFFSENTVRWPKKMREPYLPKPLPKEESSGTSSNEPKGELY